MSDDESEMEQMRKAPKYASLQMQRQRMGARMRDVAEKFAPREEEDQDGFRAPRSRVPVQKREKPFEEELPQEFGRKFHATDPTEIHNNYERKDLKEELMKEEVEQEDDFLIGPPVPKETEEVDENEFADFIKNGISFPVSHQAVLKGHNRGVMALDIDPSGNRVITGGSDYQLNFYDFQGMNQKLKPYRTLQPFEGHPITSLCFNNTGSNLLVSAGKNTVKVYTRDGIDVQETMKGDIYLRDMVHTKGHAEIVNEARWNPGEKDLFATVSYDGTLRLWDLNSKHIGLDQNITYQHLLKLRGRNGMKAAGNCCCYAQDGGLVVAGTTGGGVHVWHRRSYFGNPTFVNYDAHKGEVSSMCFTQDSLQLFSRGTDSSVKMWDLRRFKEAVHVWQNMPNESPRMQVSLSPDEKYVITGSNIINTHVPKGVIGQLVFCDTKTFEIAAQINISNTSIYRAQWHPTINQILVSCGDGATRVLYSPETSIKGVMTALGKRPKTNVDDIEYERDIITLDTVHKIRDNKPKYVRDTQIREDFKATHKPEPPREGRLATNSIAAYIMTQIHRKTERDEDPREALLKHADEAAKNPMWVDLAYAQTQPKPIFNYEAPVRDEVKFLESKKAAKCAKCGQKYCSCNKKLTDDIDLDKQVEAK